MDVIGTPTNDFSGRFNPGFNSHTAVQINPFVKFRGLEFFGIYEISNNKTENVATGMAIGGAFTQIGAELLYRFAHDHLYLGGRYNSVSGTYIDGGKEAKVDRMNFGAGWFISDNILTKVEYMTQSYTGVGYTATQFQGATFNGLVIEAVIGF